MAGKDGTEIIIEFGLIFLAPFNIIRIPRDREGGVVRNLFAFAKSSVPTEDGGANAPKL